MSYYIDGGGIFLLYTMFLEAIFLDELIVNRDILDGMEKGYFYTKFLVLPEVQSPLGCAD